VAWSTTSGWIDANAASAWAATVGFGDFADGSIASTSYSGLPAKAGALSIAPTSSMSSRCAASRPMPIPMAPAPNSSALMRVALRFSKGLSPQKPQRWVGRVVRGEEDRIDLAREALQDRLFFNKGHNDVPRLGCLLPAHQDKIALDDVRVHHAVATHAEREEVFPLARQPRSFDGDAPFPIFFSQERSARSDAAENRHRSSQ
jgi:hypothetical protein